MEITLNNYLFVAAVLFAIGLMGVIMRRNLLIIYMSLEMMLQAANLTLRRLQPLQRSSRRPGLRLLRHHRRRGGSRGRAGAHRRALPPEADHRGAGPHQAQVLGTMDYVAWFLLLTPLAATVAILVRLHRRAELRHRRLGRLGRRFASSSPSPSPAGWVPAPASFMWIDLPGFQVDFSMIFDPALQGHAPRRHRRRPAHPYLLHRLHGPRSGQGTLLRRALHLHVLDDRHRPGRRT